MIKKNINFIFLYCFVLLTLFIIVNNSTEKYMFKNSLKLGSMYKAQNYLLQHEIDLYKFMRVRNLNVVDSHHHERYRLRYVRKFFEIQLFLWTQQNISPSFFKYIFILLYSLVFFIAYIFCIKLFNLAYKKRILIFEILASGVFLFLLSYNFVIQTEFFIGDKFVLYETLAIAIALYASIKQKLFLFLFAVLLGVSTRESGMFISLFYPLFNYQLLSKYKSLLLLLLGPFLFILINLDIILNITINQLLFLHDDNSSNISLIKIFSHLIKYGVFFFPLFFMLWKTHKDGNNYNILMLIFIYLIVIFMGSFIGNMFLIYLFVPFYLLVFGQYLNKIHSV